MGSSFALHRANFVDHQIQGNLTEIYLGSA